MDRDKLEKAVRMVLEGIGERPDREGLKETPRRVAEMYAEIFGGIDKPLRLKSGFGEPLGPGDTTNAGVVLRWQPRRLVPGETTNARMGIRCFPGAWGRTKRRMPEWAYGGPPGAWGRAKRRMP